MVDPQKFDTRNLDPHARHRTVGRELAMKLLYVADIRGREDVETGLKRMLVREPVAQSSETFALELFRGVQDALTQVDDAIKATADNWDLARMAYIDRALLRLGTYELLHRLDVPPKVAISEAIELSKRYSTDKSSSFVNGILDKIYQLHPREGATDPVPEPAVDPAAAPQADAGTAAPVGA